MGCHIAKGAGLSLEGSDSVKAVARCNKMSWVSSTMSKASAKGIWGHPPETAPGKGLANGLYRAPPPLNEDSKCALVCVDNLCGLTQAFPCHQASQATSIVGLEKLSTMGRCPHRIDSD